MTNKKNYLEIYDFFDDPDHVRNDALNSNYFTWMDDPNTVFSGYRAEISNEKIVNELIYKLQKINSKKIKTFACNYHLNPKISMHGFPHTDSNDDNSFAGVIYLSKIIPIKECGTTLYEDLPENKIQNDYIPEYRSKLEIVYCTHINQENVIKKQFSQECLNFKNNILKKIVSIENCFNKLLCYPSNVMHSPDFYFGDSKQTSRLTIAYHGTLADAI